jgi:hypothetical protein
MSAFFQIDIAGTDLSVVLEDDDRVAYAYLTQGGKMVADVWLYNVADPPDQDPWKDRTQLPFLNPRRFCKQDMGLRITDTSEVSCTLVSGYADIEVDGQLVARLGPGTKPGWSKGAAIDGPLAKSLTE